MRRIVNLKNKIYDAVSGYFQWNKGQILQITGVDLAEGAEIHFSLQRTGGNAAVKKLTPIENGYEVKIPQFIFEGDAVEDYEAYAYIYQETEDAGKTTHWIRMHIAARPKPDDYVHGKDEVLTWKKLENRINELEQKGVSEERIAEAVNAYLADNGIETDVYMRVSDGYIQYSTDNKSWNNVIAVSDLKGERGPKGDKGDTGEKGESGRDGKDGYTPIKGKDYFTEADKSEIVSSVIALLPVYGGEVASA